MLPLKPRPSSLHILIQPLEFGSYPPWASHQTHFTGIWEGLDDGAGEGLLLLHAAHSADRG